MSLAQLVSWGTLFYTFSLLMPAIERELGGRVEDHYARFDETPLASASIAQVHAATLRRDVRPVEGEPLAAGARVAVKVVGPGVEAAIAAGNTIAGVAKSMGVLKDRLFRHLRKAGSRAGALPTEQELIVGAIRTYAMRKAGLSKAEIARALGVPFDRVTYILRMFDEHGRRRRPKKTQL
jgi:hypothetical protein